MSDLIEKLNDIADYFDNKDEKYWEKEASEIREAVRLIKQLQSARPNNAKAMIAEGMKAIDRDLLYRAVSDKIAEEHDTKLVTDSVVLDALLAVCEEEENDRS